MKNIFKCDFENIDKYQKKLIIFKYVFFFKNDLERGLCLTFSQILYRIL
jgi:galactose-1-phosphate uridylyltransferase